MKEGLLVDPLSTDEVETQDEVKKEQTHNVTVRYFLIFLLLSVLFLFMCLIIGSIIKEVRQDGKVNDDENNSEMLMGEIKADNIRKYLKNLTSTPHLAGTAADLKQAEQLKAFWEEQGMTSVTITPFTVLLSYPDQDQPNLVKLLDEDGDAIFTSQMKEEVLRPEQDHPDVVPPFNAYSATGNPAGGLIYVNYGRLEDFNWLKERGINFSGCICIARNEQLARNNKAHNAQVFGASGMLLYSDPADSSRSKVVYPRSWWLPDTGVQRGTVKMMKGDPLTPGYPAIESAYRQNEEDVNFLKIPVHPISYGDAMHLMKDLSGEQAPSEWRGGLDIDYNIGPGFTNPQWKVQMSISTHNVMRNTYNVHGVIEGRTESDRYVLLGNHRDSWVFGATDPSGGSAAVMEVSRAMGVMLKQGWRPRRSIVFCSWGAEEYGIIGSTEWVEYYSRLLFSRAVIYINVDSAVLGTHVFSTRALPLTHKIPNPNNTEVLHGRNTVYDTWLHVTHTITDRESQMSPLIHLPGSGTDFDPFIQKVGVTVADFQYRFSPELDLNDYPLYHTAYESFYYVDHIIDPGFKFHKAIAQIIGETARLVADSVIIPYDVTDYSHVINHALTTMMNKYGRIMKSQGLESQIEYLKQAMANFANVAEHFKNRLDLIDRNNPSQVRMVNDQLMMLSRAFIDSDGLPGRSSNKNMAFSPSIFNTYDATAFPGLADSLYLVDPTSDTNSSSSDQWEVVKKQLSIATFIIESAADSLKNHSMF